MINGKKIFHYDLVYIFRVTVNFVTPDGTKLPAKAKVGDNLLDIVIENDLDIDGFGWFII